LGTLAVLRCHQEEHPCSRISNRCQRATILLNDNTITRNGTGISATNSGQLISYGNNKNNDNLGPEGAPTGLFGPM